MHSFKKSYMAYPYVVWVIICTVIPLFIILGYALTDANGGITAANLLAIFEPIHLKALLISLKVALITTVICLVIAYPAAMILHRIEFINKHFVAFLCILPMWMNFMLRILAWQIILSNNGILNHVLTFIGVGKVHILYTESAVILGMVYDFLPYMILPIFNALERIDDSTIEAAQDLGANRFKTFTSIILPLSKNGVFSGIIMVFVPALSSFVVSNLLGGGKVLLIGNVIEQEFTLSRNWNLGSGLSIVLMIFVLISMGIMNSIDGDNEGGMLV